MHFVLGNKDNPLPCTRQTNSHQNRPDLASRPTKQELRVTDNRHRGSRGSNHPRAKRFLIAVAALSSLVFPILPVLDSIVRSHTHQVNQRNRGGTVP